MENMSKKNNLDISPFTHVYRKISKYGLFSGCLGNYIVKSLSYHTD